MLTLFQQCVRQQLRTCIANVATSKHEIFLFSCGHPEKDNRFLHNTISPQSFHWSPLIFYNLPIVICHFVVSLAIFFVPAFLLWFCGLYSNCLGFNFGRCVRVEVIRFAFIVWHNCSNRQFPVTVYHDPVGGSKYRVA